MTSNCQAVHGPMQRREDGEVEDAISPIAGKIDEMPQIDEQDKDSIVRVRASVMTTWTRRALRKCVIAYNNVYVTIVVA